MERGVLLSKLTSFIGRVEVLDELRRRLPATRLLTLTGPPGVGKTRLAYRIAADEQPHWPDGVWLVELAGLADERLVAKSIASALAIQEQPGVPILTTLVESMQSLHSRIVLDNCEHLVASVTRVVALLLRRCPHVHVLTTSREPLGVAGEVVWPVPPLTVPIVAAATASELDRYEAVRLFAERATDVRHSFALTDRNAPAVAQICQRLDGIPLAIELAAARALALSPEEIARRLDDRFHLLTVGGREALPRQQTLQTAVDWSYDLLPDGERLLFARLSVFADGFSLAAAEGVCSGDGLEWSSVLDLLTGLVSRSLVVADERDGVTRYRLLETLREYAGARLRATGEDATLRTRHAGWYAHWAEAGEPRFWNRYQAIWLAELELELFNIRQALSWCLGSGDDGHLALQLVAAVWRLWDMSHHVSEGRDWLEQALARAQVPCVARVRALHELSHLRLLQGDHVTTQVLDEEALAASRTLGYVLGEGLALGGLVLRAFTLGDIDEAERLADEAVAWAHTVDEPIVVYYNLVGQAAIARHRGETSRAIEAWEEAVALARAVGDAWFCAHVLCGLGYGRLGIGDLDGAASAFREALVQCDRLWNTSALAVGLEGLGAVAAARGDLIRQVRLCSAASAVLARCGISRPPFSDPDISSELQSARRQLGDVLFTAAWAEGAMPSLDEAIADALGEAGSKSPSTGPRRSTTSASGRIVHAPGEAPAQSAGTSYGLSPRELEVARLIADGLSNREIAATLMVSVRTAATHVEHILNKLKLRRRAQIAAWACAHANAGA